jgi:hypothetical protein
MDDDQSWEALIEEAVTALRVNINSLWVEVEALKARLEGYEAMRHEVLKLGGRVNALYQERKGTKR